MFRKVKPKINGVELPEDFNISSVINNIAISTDGKYAAVSDNGDIFIGEIPDNGKIEFEGTKITYQKGNINLTGSMGNMNISNSIISGGNIVTGAGNKFQYEIDELYEVTPKDEIALDSKNGKLTLNIIEGYKVRVEGLTSAQPAYTRNPGRLYIDDLQGKLSLPKSISDLELALESKNGIITGDIMHPGFVETKNGNISLNLYNPLILDATTSNGSVDVSGMLSQGNGRYIPVGETAIGKLRVSTKNGSVTINYIKK